MILKPVPHWKPKACSVESCIRAAKWEMKLQLFPPDAPDFAWPITVSFPFLTCDTCREAMRVEDVLATADWAEITETLKKAAYVPDPATAKLAFEEIR